jgi:protein disulfide-isomerase-like protein
MLAKLKEFDFYRKIPRDLTEATSHGSMLSICCTLFMLTLFVAELWAYLSTTYVSNVVIDPVSDSLLRINFNITVVDLPCEFAVIDVVDVLGTRTENVTKNINKWQIDEAGIRRNYEGRNWDQPDLAHDEHHNLEQLLSNGVHATPINAANFNTWIKSHKYTFVNFYAPWCIWCQRLEPVWEAFAETGERQLAGYPVSIVKVDCVENRDLCMEHKIQAFPTLRMFKDGEPSQPDYRNDRTVEAFIEFVKQRLAQDAQVAQMDPATREAHETRKENMRTDHPGCLLSGFLLVNRVPGHFHIEARSKFHNLNPAGSNMSHIVHQLSFGPTLSRNALRRIEEVSDEYFNMDSTHPMDDKMYINQQLHTSYHHYIKVVSTHLEVGARYTGKDAILAYQMVESSQLMSYNVEDVPEARFSYDLSPMSVVVTRKGKRFYEFLTSVCAIIGGTFTVVSLFNSFLSILFKPKRV